jgi:prepilin-type N-terminal cleavage/methylation domain-containing protein/prepilin-type processing-associated H-X9-DG protein
MTQKQVAGACRDQGGFTLVEMLVTITIIVAIALLAFMGARRALESARIANNISNLRNLGVMVTNIAQDNGSFPPGWSFSKGESWADLVIRSIHGDSVYQDPVLLSPLVARSIPSNLKQTAISNYSVSPFIFVQEDPNDFRGYRVTPARLQRPSEQILLGDALPRSEKAAYGFSMVVWWGLRFNTGNTGNPPVSPPARANQKVALPDNIAKMTHDGGVGLPAFRNRGKGHFLFADGHVEALAPNELLFKHFAISY